MVRIVSYVLGLSLLIAGAVWLADRPGAVTVDWLGWRVETTVPILLIALLIVGAGLGSLFRLIVRVLRWPSTWAARHRDGRRRKGYLALTDGLAAAAGGELRKAQKLAGRAEKLLADPALTRLLSAQTAQLSGDAESARAHFEAMLERPETAALGLRGLLKQALERGDETAAVDLAQRSRAITPADRWLTDCLYDLLVRTGRLREAQDLLDDAVRKKALPREEAASRKATLLQDRAQQAAAEGDERSTIDFARKALQADPTLTSAVLCLARAYADSGKTRRAASVLETAWAKHPSADLVQAYGDLVPGEEALPRLRRLEKLVARRPDDMESHLALAQAAFDAKVWGQARRHLLAAADARPSVTVFRMLARLEQAEYNNQAAAQAWLDKAAALAA
jgi:HemY protein